MIGYQEMRNNHGCAKVEMAGNTYPYGVLRNYHLGTIDTNTVPRGLLVIYSVNHSTSVYGVSVFEFCLL
jgi:hypothetical protein